MVLLVVLVVITLLSALLTEFAFSTLVDLRLAETFRDSTRANYLAAGGVRVGRMLLQEDKNAYDGPGELWSQGLINYPVAEGYLTVQIEDLGGKLNLNGLLDASGNMDVVARDRLFRLFETLALGDPQAMSDALLDWLDRDDDPRTLGAENPDYQRLDPPRSCKNGPLDTLEELALVMGFSPETITRLAPHVCVQGAEKINVNTASIEVLQSLAEQMTAEAVDTIVQTRAKAPFRAITEIRDLPGLADIYGFFHLNIDVKSPIYRIESHGMVGDGRRSITAVVDKNSDRLLYQKVN